MDAFWDLCRLAVVFVFATSAIQKFVERDQLAVAIRGWGLAYSRRPRATAAALIGAEASVPLLALAGLSPVALWVAVAVLAVVSAGAVVLARRGQGAACLCFGVSASPPVDGRTIARNGLLLLAAVAGHFSLGHRPDAPVWLAAAFVVAIVLMEDAQHFMWAKGTALRRLGATA